MLDLSPTSAAITGAPVWSPGSELPAMLARFFAAPDPRSVWKWAEDCVVLDAKQSPGNPGPYRSAKAPHTRFLQEKFADPSIHQFTIKKNSQGAWTEAVLNCIRSSVARRPANVLYMIDSITEARRIASIRLADLARGEATKIAMEEDAGKSSTLTLNLRDMFIMFAGGGSIGAVANKPIEIGVVDEADKIPRITGGHGHVVYEMKARFKTVPGSKLFVLSAPNEAQDVTTKEYENGSQHKLFIPCPHCDHFQEMIQERLEFNHCKNLLGEFDQERVLRETYYKCERAGTPECADGRIYDHHKPAMLERAEWRATNSNPEPGHMSMESSDLFSLFDGAAFGRIALDLIKALKDPLERRSIQRDRFGKEYRARRAEVKKSSLQALRGPYKRGTFPGECVYLGMGSDYGEASGIKWAKGGWARNGDLYIVDWGDALGLDQLIVEADKPVRETLSDREHVVACGLVDEGWKQDVVLSFCVRAKYDAFNFRFLPSKGRGQAQSIGGLVSESPRVHEGHTFMAYHFNDPKFKSSLYISRILEFPDIKSGRSKVPRLWFPEDVDGDFLEELMGEALEPVVNEWGQTRMMWKKTGPNHWGDAVKDLLVLWHVVGAEVLAGLPKPEPAPVAA